MFTIYFSPRIQPTGKNILLFWKMLVQVIEQVEMCLFTLYAKIAMLCRRGRWGGAVWTSQLHPQVMTGGYKL